jgi:cytochrome c biogenesis protein CcmG, thiol:disulfide interchange protein DsbE
VRLIRCFLCAIFLPLAVLTACNRGSRPAQTGKPAPDFAVSDGTTSVRLSNYRGHVVLVNFWASWCMPCVAEVPSLLDLHHEQPGLVILAVSIDDDAAAYKKFIARNRIDFITVRDPEQKAARLFNTSMWPETYVIDRQGMIRRKFVGPQNWVSPEITRYLKSL